PSGYGRPPSGYGQKPVRFQPCTGTPFKKKTFNQPSQGFRKFNKPRPSYSPQIRTASIEEVEEEEENEDEDNNVSYLAARTARLSEEQREQWIEEMNAAGIHF
ncbi:MAG: hypothetical protein WBW72_02810, partial [Erwinia billingiae]